MVPVVISRLRVFIVAALVRGPMTVQVVTAVTHCVVAATVMRSGGMTQSTRTDGAGRSEYA